MLKQFRNFRERVLSKEGAAEWKKGWKDVKPPSKKCRNSKSFSSLEKHSKTFSWAIVGLWLFCMVLGALRLKEKVGTFWRCFGRKSFFYFQLKWFMRAFIVSRFLDFCYSPQRRPRGYWLLLFLLHINSLMELKTKHGARIEQRRAMCDWLNWSDH